MLKIACDVHTHTLFSRHAYSTVEEDVQSAADAGLELLGITDHFSCMLFEEQTLKNFQYYINMGVWPREWHGVRLLHGCEADIVDVEGHLFGHDIPVTHNITEERRREATLKSKVFDACDYVIASIHRKDFCDAATRAQNTQMYINVLEDPKVLILGHVGRSGVDFELDPVLEAARNMGKLIEINESSIAEPLKAKKSLARCEKVARRCAELGCSVSFGSDAHIAPAIGRADHTRELLERIDFPEELVACASAERFLAAARAALPDFEL
ncbi:phosphatase [Paratractidigestivibacter sp.]|uniref:phosphatase n=1 Tax=Paratractidigestivibacter sp. TaxID=2847316 RepID=UPI002AC8E693|nr:phosphatase [Paratractidigestivibacter sp.]